MIGAICQAGHDAEQGGLGTPVTTTLSSASRWQLSLGYRWQDSFRHFVGNVEQKQRETQHTFIENKIHLFDVALSYRVSPRWSLSFGAPIMTADRISHRTHAVTHSTGVGDISIGAKTWIFRPPTESRQNIQVGYSIKLPTGKKDVSNTNAAGVTQNVDQSIQLGDGGLGFSLDYMAFKSIQRFTVFSAGVYLFNPRNTNGVRTGRNPVTLSGEGIMSVADQYLWQAGVGYAVPKLNGLAFTLTGRMEGIPARDLIGKEDGFRRPGYAVSVGPGIMFSRGRDTWSASFPMAVRRDRTRSVPDIIAGRHGDAAFADGLVLVNYSRTF